MTKPISAPPSTTPSSFEETLAKFVRQLNEQEIQFQETIKQIAIHSLPKPPAPSPK